MNTTVACAALVNVLVIAVAPADADTQWFRCYPIRPGDTAAQTAWRLTGNHLNVRAPWFQIFDSQRRLVSKARYGAIRSSWRACVAEGPAPTTAIQRREPPQPAAALLPAAVPLVDPPRTVEDPVLWYLISLALGGAAVALVAVDSWTKRQALVRVMQRYGGEFVREFARPWTEYRGGGQRPRARLRLIPRRSRVEILFAPAPGQTYPNLSDHRRNVEYDVARVIAALKHQPFAGVQPYAEGDWVVLPFHFTGRDPKEGVR